MRNSFKWMDVLTQSPDGYLHAGCNLSLTTGEQTYTAATAKTALQVIAAAQHRVRLIGISIYFKDTVVTDTPVLVKLCRQTTAGTPGSSPAFVKKDENMGETIQTTAGINYSGTEPTITDVLETKEIHPQTGEKFFWPFAQEIYIKGGNRFGIQITAAQTQTGVVNIEIEE